MCKEMCVCIYIVRREVSPIEDKSMVQVIMMYHPNVRFSDSCCESQVSFFCSHSLFYSL